MWSIYFLMWFPLFCNAFPAFNNLTRIVGGVEASYGENPSVAAITKKGMPICGCSIVDQYHVVTAAHCITSKKSPNLYKIIVGVQNIDNYKLDANAKLYEIQEMFVHERYESVDSGYDIAVMRTKEKIEYNTNVQPATIPRPLKDKCDFATVYGWGATSDGGYPSDTLLKVSVPFVPHNVCNKKYGKEGYRIQESQVCYGYDYGGKDSCTGDSGGPLICNQYPGYLIGVVSYGIGCAEAQYPGVYTRVATYFDWISDVIESRYY